MDQLYGSMDGDACRGRDTIGLSQALNTSATSPSGAGPGQAPAALGERTGGTPTLQKMRVRILDVAREMLFCYLAHALVGGGLMWSDPN